VYKGVKNPFGSLKRLYVWTAFMMQLVLLGRSEVVGEYCPAVENLVGHVAPPIKRATDL
jgi:hypothetical protein